MAHLGRRLRDSGSVIDCSQLPSPSPAGSYHLDHSNNVLAIREIKSGRTAWEFRLCVCFLFFFGYSFSVLEIVDDGGDHAHFLDKRGGRGGVVDGE